MKLRPDYRRAFAAPVLVFCIFAVLRISGVIDTAYLTRENEYVAVILLELIIFLLPGTIYVSVTDTDIRTLRIKPVGIGHVFLIISAVLAISSCQILLSLASAGSQAPLSQSFDLYGIFISKNSGSAGSVIYNLIAYAILPAICEEFVFRSVLCHEYERYGSVTAIFMSSLFFAMIHFDLSMFPTYFVSGVILALTFYACRSVVASVFVHLLCNVLSLFNRAFMQTLYNLGGEKLFRFIIVSVFLLSMFLFCAECSRLYGTYSSRSLSSAYRDLPPDYSADDLPGIRFFNRHPRISAFFSCLFFPTALACYVFFIVAVLI